MFNTVRNAGDYCLRATFELFGDIAQKGIHGSFKDLAIRNPNLEQRQEALQRFSGIDPEILEHLTDKQITRNFDHAAKYSRRAALGRMGQIVAGGTLMVSSVVAGKSLTSFFFEETGIVNEQSSGPAFEEPQASPAIIPDSDSGLADNAPLAPELLPVPDKSVNSPQSFNQAPVDHKPFPMTSLTVAGVSGIFFSVASRLRASVLDKAQTTRDNVTALAQLSARNDM